MNEIEYYMIKIIYDIYSLLFQFYFLLNLVVKVSLDWLDSRCFKKVQLCLWLKPTRPRGVRHEPVLKDYLFGPILKFACVELGTNVWPKTWPKICLAKIRKRIEHQWKINKNKKNKDKICSWPIVFFGWNGTVVDLFAANQLINVFTSVHLSRSR